VADILKIGVFAFFANLKLCPTPKIKRWTAQSDCPVDVIRCYVDINLKILKCTANLRFSSPKKQYSYLNYTNILKNIIFFV
jgi:hypothetical protein